MPSQASRINLPFHFRPDRIVKTKGGKLWILGWGYNYIEVDSSTLQFQLHPVSSRFQYKSIMMDSACMFEDQYGFLWFGKRPFGLYRLNPKTGEIVFEINNPQLPSSISGNDVIDIYADKANNTWVSTYRSLDRIEKIGSRYQKKRISRTKEFECNTIGLDYANQVWLGTNKGLAKYNRRDSKQFVLNESTTFFSDPSQSIETIRSLRADASGKLWVGTPGFGIGYFDLNDKAFHRIPIDPTTYAWRMLNVTHVKYIAIKNQILWFGTVYSGLGRVNLKTNDVHWFADADIGLKNINVIVPTENDSVFIGTSRGGLFYLDQSQEGVTQYPFTETYSEWDQSKLLGTSIHNIVKTDDNHLWIVTKIGLNLLDIKTGVFRVWRQQDGLLEPGGVALNIVPNGNMFLAFPLSGIFMFNPNKLIENTGTFQKLNQSEIYIQENEINQSVVTQDGSLLYLADKSIFEIEPHFQTPYIKKSASTIQIQSILINSQPFQLSRFAQSEAIQLRYWQNQLTIQYAVLDYLDPTNNVSRYRLVQNGVGDEWSTANGFHQVQYRDLGAGTYQFEVEGKHPSGQWGKTQISFVITPPFWKTWLFYSLAFIALAGAAYGMFAYRIRNIRAQNRMLEQKVLKRTTQLRTEMEYSKKILDSSPSIIFGFSTDGSLTYINPSGESMLACSREKMLGEKWWNLIAFQDDQDQLKQIHNELQDYDFYDQEMDLTIQTGKTHHLVWNFVNHFNEKGKLQETLAFGLDMTDQIEREISKTSAREQRRIGQEIHDSVCQTLTGVTLMCESLEKKKDQMQEDDAAVILQVLNHVQRANDQSRRIAHGLYLHELEADGLETALIALTENIENLFRLPCSYRSNKPFSIDNVDVATQIYRIVQEAMSNAAKYSQSTRIQLQVEVEADNIRFVISDDGIGFKVSDSSNKGMGLNIMRHRAKLIHAAFEIQSQINKGTTVRCTFPVTL